MNRLPIDHRNGRKCDVTFKVRNLRDISLHFKAPRAETRLKDSQIALGFDRDKSRQHEFRKHGMQNLLRAAARAYFLARL